ncbi:uncharacterized protein N7515_007025 [Penicillium bovifimosum]|uniref:Structure-specific endonuclease subunit SLX4 n=1 Tax=Penicillium bovifimosum TaxID=126998 RepID=A0A9W9L1A4_9EURO|nr:uncharacterized protein N7515_007025 [Penicillium bovifimosum]KAJ5130986.1 hypothetical protein N7515_007025 [Penicillium bovifimosum]
MASAADVIILSSSPNPVQSLDPGPGRNDVIQVSHDSSRGPTPPPIPSKSTLSKSQTRSRFFPTPIASAKNSKDETRPKKRSTGKDYTSRASDQNAVSKPRRNSKKSADATGTTALENHQQEPGGEQNDAMKPTRGRPRKNAKTKESGNMTLAGKVTKTSGDPSAKKSSKGGKKTVAKEHLPSEDGTAKTAAEFITAPGEDRVLHLDEAVRRRLDWTPPRDTVCEEVTVVRDGSSQDTDRDPDTAGGLDQLLSGRYNYSGSNLNPRDSVQSANGGPTKRRRIELVSPDIQALLNRRQSDSSDQTSSEKPKKTTKAKPKKFTTLTARMTAQYAINDTEDEEPVLECVPPITTAKNRRKAKVAEKESLFTVLSPEAAVESLKDQDLVFGTCSQLEREDSPQTLREIQQAIRASEGISEPEGIRDNGRESRPTSTVRSVARLAGTRNLWGVSARDAEGSLIRSETLDVVDLTDGKETLAETSYNDDEQVKRNDQKDWFELADLDSPAEKKSSSLPLAKNDTGPDTLVSIPAQASAPAPAPVPAPAPAAKAKSKATATKAAVRADQIPASEVNAQPSVPQVPEMPRYAGFTDAELSKQVSQYGFKAVRGRKKMIELLQQCWRSKHGTSAAVDDEPICQPEQQKDQASEMSNDPKLVPEPNVKPKPTAKSKASTKNSKPLGTTKSALASRTDLPTSPQRTSRGKPTTTTSFFDVEEIQDSEEEILPSPSQVQKHYTDLYSKSKAGGRMELQALDILTRSPSPSPTKRKVVSKVPTKKRSSASITTTRKAEPPKEISLAEISAQITQAIRVQPRLAPLSSSRGSRSRPTWHEKILMYDPIVLEDLTAWLNIEGLGLVGEDREVWPGLVREWCESKGICCCWKKNASW